MMNEDMKKRIMPQEYDKCRSRFVSEYGYVGVCCKETTLKYLDTDAIDYDFPEWLHHTNVFEKGKVDGG